MPVNGNRFKKIAYDFDLVSGKVNQVSYQLGQPDAFYHKYVYDAENRITHVLTSSDSINWDNDAFYQYYDHGPLARTIIGEQQVQGINHAYNLQGWLKTFNPDVHISGNYTLKEDGSTGSVVGKPAYQVMLNYFNGDYKAISGATSWNGSAALGNDYRQLYNGNISSMAVDIKPLNNPFLYNYQYDQLNRLVAMDAFKKGSDWGSLTPGSDFQERISYDPNGNILGYRRNGNTFAGKPLGMDSLNYSYVMGTNRLDHVTDTVPAGNYTEDIDSQTAGNYAYDSIGNLVKDNAEGITSISWTVYGKIRQIVKGDSVVISYTYDPGGNRISKEVIRSGTTDTARTWYVRDAQGNVISVYEAGRSSVNEGRLTQSELHLYGSSRVGLLRRSLDVAEEYNPADTTMPLLGTGLSHTFGRGNKLFELSNHLGNVLVTVNDKKLGVSSNNNTIDYFNPQVVSAQDYYPFGMLQPGRVFNSSGYRFGFNGKENDNELKGDGGQQDYGMRIYDVRVGRFLSVDPLTKDYPWYTPYQYAGNTPIQAVDLDGQEEYHYLRVFDQQGSPVLVEAGVREIVDRVVVGYRHSHSMFNDAPVPIYENVINKRQEYIVHDTYTAPVDENPTFSGNVQVNRTFDLRWHYASEEDARLNRNGSRDMGDWLAISLYRTSKATKEENMANGGGGMAANVGAMIAGKLFKTASYRIAQKYAKMVLNSSGSRTKKPFTIAVVFDYKTKKFYWGKNKGVSSLNEVVDEVKDRLLKESRTGVRVYNCAEVDAYNKAMKDKADWDNLKHITLELDHKNGTYKIKDPCLNCEVPFGNKVDQPQK